ncbi:Ig-like domain repeat protein [Edaphobacter aggregans]|uniref:Ig-like domain repeat protein n=1 Tax=Edaphobacter aggregans TaxID=570835 RepID=UPI000556D992|nr:Ig-like domain repeat protein [Edaphobacter aggregans]
MTSPKSPRSAKTSHASLIGKPAFQLLLLFAAMLAAPGAFATTATTTTLSISSTSVPYKTPITLTATVTAGGSPVTSGLVLFCDATAPFCENNSSLLGMVQLTASSATAVVKIGSGPQGVHSYKAVYRANNTYSSSTSNTVSYTVQGTYASKAALASSGSVGSYTLAATITGIGSVQVGPSGTVSFLDTSAGNNVLGTQALGAPVLSNAFSQAPNSPFDIGDGLTSVRTVAIASAYLDGDNNLDVITGDADQVITVLLGDGDGTFQSKVNYAGCQTGKTLKIQLADFNRDGITDVALGCSNGNNGGIAILTGNGNGSFRAPVYYATGDLAGLAKGDFNGDGILDLVVTDKLQQNVKVLLGNGDGTFHAPVTAINTPSAANDIVVADFNGDGNDDLGYAVATAASGSTLSDLYIALGNGTGTFPTTQLKASEIGEFLTSGDTNGDNIVDLVSSTVTLSGPKPTPHITNSMFVLIGKGDGTFQPTATYISDIPSDPHLTDVNGDGKADIIAGGSFGALVYHGNGDGTFQPYSEPFIGGTSASTAFSLTYAVNAGDYNNDGNADLIGTDANDPRAAVALSEVQQTADAAALTGVAVFPLGSGIHDVDASYGGDAVFLPSISSTVALRAAPVPTTLALNVSPASGTLSGQAVTLTATLSPFNVSGPPSTTTDGQAVKFYSGATQIGTGTLNNGVATLNTTALPAGSNALKAVYPGDENYSSSTSSVISVTVSNVLLTSSPNPSDYLQSVTLTATVPSGATGSVTFKDGSTTLGTAPISGATASLSTSTLTAGSHSLTAVYGGDGSHSTATSPTVTQVVNKITPIMSVSTAGQSTYLSPVTITATLPSGTTGTVTFTSGAITLGTATVSGGSASITTTALPVGNANPILASYGGDSNYNPASASTTRSVTKASPSSTLTSSANPSAFGASVTFTDTLPTSVTGTVTFTAGGSTIIGTSNIANGVATISTSSLAVGNTTITATYNGDGNNNTSVASLVQAVNKSTPSMALTSSANPSLVNQSVTLTATLPNTVTGTVSFTNGATTLGTATIANGVATVSTSSLPLGSNNISAQYSGDTNNNTATATLTQVVNKATPTITVTTSGPSTWGQTVTITASVPAGATGTITITSNGNPIGSGSVSAAGIVTVTTSTLPVGTDPILASYSGDSNNNPATGTTNQVVSKATPTVIVTTSGPSNYGDPVTITATLPPGVTGTVTITTGGTTIGTGNVSAAGTVTVTTSTLPVGTNPITASYGGDSNNNPATGSTTQTVSKVAPAISVASSLNPSTYGQSVTFTATFSSSTATGTITFSDGGTVLGIAAISGGSAAISTSALNAGTHPITAAYSGDATWGAATSAPLTQIVNKATPILPPPVVSNPNIPSGTPETITETVPPGVTGSITFENGGTPIGTAPIIGGVATITVPNLPVGSNPITASTPGDANNNPATSPATTVTVTKSTLTVTLVSSINPSTYGQSVTFTATLSSGVTGTVTFTDGATVLGTSPVTNGHAAVTASTLTVGTHTIVATYGGDSNNNQEASAPLTQTVTKTTPVLPPPSVSNPNPTPNTPVTITESVPPGTTGSVTFENGGTPIGTAPIVGGTATITVPSLPIGSNPITASVPETSSSNAATSPATTVTVATSAPTVTIASSLNPAPLSQAVTFTATLSATAATGTVTFHDGSSVLGTGAVNGGVAVFTTSTLTVGTHTITATYGGDTAYSTASSGPLSQVIGKLPTTTVLSQSAGSQMVNGSVTFIATVSSTLPNPTGTVTFLDGTTVLGTAALSTNGGNASLTISTLSGGSHTITAVYSGDNSFLPSTSAPINNVVHDFTNTNTGAAKQDVFPGEGTTFKFTLAPTGTTTFISDVNLTVTGLPEGTTYTFSPATVGSGASSTAVTLDLKTSDKLQALNSDPRSSGSHGTGTIALGMLGLLGLGTARRYRRRMPRMLLTLLLLAGSLLPVAALSGCAGGYFTLKPTTYTVTVTGTEGTIQHSATATLVVQ